MSDKILEQNFPGFVIVGFMLAVLVLCLVAGIIFYWLHTRREEIRANLVRELIDRGVPLDQVERLASRSPEDIAGNNALEGKLATVMVENEVPAAALEQVMHIFRQTDPATRQAMFKSIEQMVESGPAEDRLVAAVAAICPPRANPATTPYLESAAANA